MLYFCIVSSFSAMELQVFISKRGTKVVTATNLYQILDLPSQHFAASMQKWLEDIYEFRDGIRKPAKMQDYAPRKLADSAILEDYYLSLELAKMVALRSKSKLKLKYAKWLQAQEEKIEETEQLSKDQVLAVLDLVKAMGLVSCQEACEKRHLRIYEERNGGDASNWWKHRADILGYSVEALREKMQQLGRRTSGKSQRQLLMQTDKYEMIRIGVIDLFMALGKSEKYARNMGDLAKTFARELGVEIFDDRGVGMAFAPPVNQQLLHAVKETEGPELLRMLVA